MSNKDSKAIKAAAHREAIQKAAVINNPGQPGSSSSSQTKTPGLTASSSAKLPAPVPSKGTRQAPPVPNGSTASRGDESLGTIAFTMGSAGDPSNDDYEGHKVTKAKKHQHEADIAMVADLDRWG
jgi:hypothetical protein